MEFRLVALAFGLLAATTALAAPRSLYRTTGNTVNTSAGVLSYAEDWNYANVRTDAYMFWWLYAVQPAANRPLIIWLQGGPGASGVGFGNFEEIGPKTISDTDNFWSWLQVADLLFVDNPVGTGFSYVKNNAYTKNITDIGVDLISWLRQFLVQHTEYRNRPFFIFSESYGGKMAAEFAYQIATASPTIGLSDFRGVALGDSWISAMDYVNTWGPYLYANSYLDDKQLGQANAQAAKCQKLVDSNEWSKATDCWGNTESLIGQLTGGVSWYNILKTGGQDDWSLATNRIRVETTRERMFRRHVLHPYQRDDLSDFMNGEIRKKLQIIPSSVSFGGQSDGVFNGQYADFMQPNYATVDKLLTAGVPVLVVNGQLDLICDSLGTDLWLDRLKWSGYAAFNATSKQPFGTAQTPLGGYRKSHANLQLFYVLRAGHMVAHDAPDVALAVAREAVTGKLN